MKKIFIAGNWKSNKTIAEAKEWLARFTVHGSRFANITVVICAPFTVLSAMREAPFALGAQNVSMYDEGAYTGEITARMIKEVADWVIIGHSERRKYFGETDAMLAQKVERAKHAGLKIIYCVPDDKTAIAPGVDVVAYEPMWAIGTGKIDTPENANNVCATIKQKAGIKTVIYGGSVTAENVAAFVTKPSIDGILAGGASLNPTKFVTLIQSAASALE